MSARPPALSRRGFLTVGALAACAATAPFGAPAKAGAESDLASRFPLIGFSKPFQRYSPGETAELVATIGWAGIECPVRARGQIEPERAPDELPRFVEALGRLNCAVHLVATDITSLQSPHAETVLRTMAKLGLKRLRLGFFLYSPDKSPTDRLKEIAPALKDVAEACRELGLQAGVQNHSGARNVGAPVWDVHSMIQDLDPRHMGFCFDIGHATVEGGLSWPTEARLAERFFTAILVKDFVWKKEGAGWKDAWCPLGEGMVNRSFFEWLKTTSYRGPICQHHEYDLGDTKSMIAHMQHDLAVLKQWLA